MFELSSHVRLISQIMAKCSLDLSLILSLVEEISSSRVKAREIITILESIFNREKSEKILLAVQVLEYCVKNCTRDFHEAANRESFQTSLLSLLKRVHFSIIELRGKTSIFKALTSNVENWTRIENIVLHLIQLWYDAFILEEGAFKFIIDNYKILRKENILFPPREANENNLIAINTNSPIFEQIKDISERDKKKFESKLNAMKMSRHQNNFESEKKKDSCLEMPKKQLQYIDVEKVAMNISVLLSSGCNEENAAEIIESIKKDLESEYVRKNEQLYWKDVKEAGNILLKEWYSRKDEVTHKKFIPVSKNFCEKYIEKNLEFNEIEQTKKLEIKSIENLIDL